MKVPTILDFLASCLQKSGLDIDTYYLSDNSGSGINIYKERNGQHFQIDLEFTGDGLRLTDVKIFKRHFTETDHTRIL